MRGTKTVNGVKSEYLYVGDQLRYEKRRTTELYCGYDGSGNFASLRIYINGTNKGVFYALINAQGDVVALCNASGTKVVTYEYDDWGKLLQSTDTSGFSLAEINPIRYRGYYYDSETGFYYLQSRYYNPEIGRFLNADGYLSTGQGVLSHNMFAYCGNNPINRIDFNGYGWLSTTWNKFKNKVKSWFETDDEPDSNAMLYSEHHKRGTTNKSNKDKHDKANSRRQKDQNGEKKNQKPGWKQNPNKRHSITIESETNMIEKVGHGLVVAGATLAVLYLVANDTTIIGAVDDALILPLIPVIWDSSARVLT